MPALDELEAAYVEAPSDPQFIAEFEQLLRTYVGRPTPLTHAKRLSDHLVSAQIYLTRPPRRTQNQQRAGAGPAGEAHGQAPHRRRDRGGAARGGLGHGGGVARPRMCCVHGHSGYGLPAA
ncbi:MAG: hypothetical protein NZM11_05875 [Anaerolineales bacterium]|nr:hypothetical protein [Anaerolineales bacterium]